MNFKNYLKQIEEEVKTIVYGPEDDKPLIDDMLKDFKRLKGGLTKFGTIKNIEMLSSSYPYGKRIFFVINNNNPIGYCRLQRRDNWPNGPDVVTMMYIKPDYRKMGIGMAFHEFLLDKGYILQADNLMSIPMQQLWKKLATKYHIEEKDGKTFAMKKSQDSPTLPESEPSGPL
jgi:Acetyltransferase (GNAT) family